MYREGHLGLREAALLGFVVLGAAVALPHPAMLAQQGITAGWAIALLSAALAGILSLPVLALVRGHPGRGLPEALQETLGTWGGFAANLVLSLWLVAETAMVLRLVTETFIVAILPRTPPTAVGASALVMALYGAYLGLEPIARANVIVWPGMVIAFVAVALAVSPMVRTDWLFPVAGPGLPSLLASSLRDVGLWSELAIGGIYAYAFRSQATLRAAALWSLGAATVSLAGTIALGTAVLGPEDTYRHPFLFYRLARLVYLGRFFQRGEGLFVLFWIVGALTHLAILLHATAITSAFTLSVPYYRPLLFPLAVVIFTVALLPADTTAALHAELAVRDLSVIPAYLIPAAAAALAALRRRRASADAALRGA